jgi:hypothetical protein
VLELPSGRAESTLPHQIEMTGPTVCETRWAEIISSFESKHDELLAGHPDCSEENWPTYDRPAYPYFAPSKWKRRTMERAGSQSRNREGSTLQASGQQGALQSHAAPLCCHPQRNAGLCHAGQPTTEKGISRAKMKKANSLRRRSKETKAQRANA